MMNKEYTLIIDLSQNLDTIWKTIKKKRRGDIRKAKRLGITIEINTSYEKFTETFINIRKLIDLPPFTISPNEFKTNGTFLFVAKYDGNIVAGDWYYTCFDKKRLRLKYAASKRYDPNVKNIAGLAHALLIWEAIKWAKENKMSIYDFGGYAPSGISAGKSIKNVNEWKKSFGGTLTEKVC